MSTASCLQGSNLTSHLSKYKMLEYQQQKRKEKGKKKEVLKVTITKVLAKLTFQFKLHKTVINQRD